MSTGVTTQPMAEASPRSLARITGAVYLLSFFTAVVGSLITPASPTSIVAHETAFRFGFALSLISTAGYVAVTVLLYRLFWPVSRNIALVAACFGLIGDAVMAFASLFQLAPLVILGGSPGFGGFSATQLQTLAQMFLDLGARAGYSALVFDGPSLLLTAYLIFRSPFLPRILAAPIALAGLGCLTFFWLPPASDLLIYIEVADFLAELLLMLWLLVFRVNAQRWKEQANAARASIHM